MKVYAIRDEEGNFCDYTLRELPADARRAFTQNALFRGETQTWKFWENRGCMRIKLQIEEVN